MNCPACGTELTHIVDMDSDNNVDNEYQKCDGCGLHKFSDGAIYIP